jgi:hypothetical protein
VGQHGAGRKGLCGSGVKTKTGHKHIARREPEHIAQLRQRARNAARGFQCAAKVTALVRVENR